MWKKAIERSKLYLDLTEDTDESNAFDTFINTLVQRYGNLQPIKDFFEINDENFYIFKWSRKHLETIHSKPIVLSILDFINAENIMDLIIAYGVWCEDVKVEPCYFNVDGTPRLGGNIEDTMRQRQCIGNVFVMVKKGATISLLAYLKEWKYDDEDLDRFGYDSDFSTLFATYVSICSCIEFAYCL